MSQEEKYRRNWRLMFEKDDLGEFIRRNSETLVSKYITGEKIYFSPGYSLYDRIYYDQMLVGYVWEDMLSCCQDDSVPVTAFDRERLYRLLKGRGFSQKKLSRNHNRIILKLDNARYEFNLKINNNGVVVDGRREPSSNAKVTSLHEEGFMEFVLQFDSVIPEIMKGMEKGYQKMKVLYEAEQRRRKKLRQMVQIAAKSRGIDYRIEFVEDKVELKFERIVFTRVEKTVTEDSLADFLQTLPELMEQTPPRVTAGKEIGLELVPVTFSPPQPRDALYKSLVKGSEEGTTNLNEQ